MIGAPSAVNTALIRPPACALATAEPADATAHIQPPTTTAAAAATAKPADATALIRPPAGTLAVAAPAAEPASILKSGSPS